MNKHVPRKRFGQNFLHDQNIIHRILDAINARRDENLIEIGPGQGALTLPLLKQTGKLTVIELDRDLIQSLNEKSTGIGQLEIHNRDVLKVDFADFKQTPLRIVGNLPYNISTPLLFHLFEQLHLINDMIFMLQKEVVDRLSADVNDSNYSRLSVMAQYHCRVDKLFDVPPGAFFPAPKVMSSIVKMVPIVHEDGDGLDITLFSKLVKQAFSQRRKMLRNNLSDFLSEDDFHTLNLSSKSRAQELCISDYISMTRMIQERNNKGL